MPTYDYACQACGARFEVRMSITAYSEGAKPVCEKCGAADVTRAFTSVNVITSGKGPGPACNPPACGSGRFT